MESTTTLLFLLLVALTGQGQNLVQNPGFESYTACPQNLGEIDRATNWSNAGAGSPDYYNTCGAAAVDIPKNSTGYQPARSGNGYAGIFLWSKGSANLGREYVCGRLSTALLQGFTYHLDMYVNLANISQYSGSRIGAYFSDTLVSAPVIGVLPFKPQVVHTGTARFDTSSWTSVSGDFVARGGERFLVIGNFNTDSLTDTLQVNAGAGTNTIIYTLIDDVSLARVNPPGAAVPVAASSMPEVGPSPFSETLRIRMPALGAYEIVLTDLQSRVLVQRQFSSELELHTGGLPAGLYFYLIRGKGGIISRDRILKL